MIFDPAGTIKHDVFIEQDDVLYGAAPSVLEFYTRAHARNYFRAYLDPGNTLAYFIR